jgi:hypothetical protein
MEMSAQVFSKRNWVLCVVALVVSDRGASNNHFISTMSKVWNLGKTSNIEAMARNTYLVEFTTAREI